MTKLLIIFLIFNIIPAFSQWKSHSPVPVNLNFSPGAVNVHYNSGGRRMVRIDNQLFILAPETDGEKLYYSVNNGQSFEFLYSEPTFSSCLISGKNKYIYHFFYRGSAVVMKKISLNPLTVEERRIFSDSEVSNSATGAYRAINATVDSSGNLYVAAHWEANSQPDQIFLLKSSDEGQTWSFPNQISVGEGPWYYPHLEVNSSNILMIVYSHFIENQLNFAKSIDGGITWDTKIITTDKYPNPALLTIGENIVLIFTQGGVQETGLQFNISYDLGETWEGFRLIDPTCGYADPSPGLGSDGTIYVAFRSSNGTGVTTGSCGDRCKSRLAMSPDTGKTWLFPDDYYDAPERVGTRNNIRYQTWFNYGGPLEWSWMQYVNNGSQHPIYYDINQEVEILNLTGRDTLKMIHDEILEFKQNPEPGLKDSILQHILKWGKQK